MTVENDKLRLDRLSGVRRKLARARFHFAAFEAFPAQLRQDNTHYARHEYNHELGQYEFYVEDDWTLDENLPVVVGDCVQNARSALDHLACALARRESKRTSFPIFNSSATFECFGGSQMELLKPSARKLIEDFQPYQGPDKGGLKSLWDLNELNNIDKHRSVLLAVFQSVGSTMGYNFPDNVWPVIATKPLLRGEVYMTAKMPFDPEAHFDCLPIGEIRLLDAPTTNRPASYVLSKILDDIENKIIPAFAPSDFW